MSFQIISQRKPTDSLVESFIFRFSLNVLDHDGDGLGVQHSDVLSDKIHDHRGHIGVSPDGVAECAVDNTAEIVIVGTLDPAYRA